MPANVEIGRSPRDGHSRLPRATVQEHDIATARTSLRTLRLMNAGTDAVLASERAAGQAAGLFGEALGRAYDGLRLLTLPPFRPFVDAHEELIHDIVVKPVVDLGHAAETFTEKRDIGVTPKTEVARHGMARLYHYESEKVSETDVEKHREPLLLVFARMNKPEIQDLAKQKSYVEAMIRKGYDVYALDWGDLKKGEPLYQEEAQKDMGDDVLDTMPHLIGAMKEHSGAKEFDMQGWCQGAVLTAMYAALQPEIQPDAGLRKIVLLTPPLDYPEDAGPLAEMVRDNTINLDAIVEANGGSMPGDAIDMGAKMRDFSKYVLGPYLAALKVVDNERARENMILMQNWMQDLTDLPGPWYLQFIEEMYRKNNLVNGRVRLTDHTTGDEYVVNLRNITIPVQVVGAELDDIAPRQQWINARDYFPNSRYVQVDEISGAGHIGLMTGKGAPKTWETINQFLHPKTESTPEQESREKRYEVTDERVKKLAGLFNTSESVARLLLPLGFHSASLADFSDENVLAIYAGHVSESLGACINGGFSIKEDVTREGNKITISYSHHQASGEVGKGTDKLILVPLHPQEQQNQTSRKEPQPQEILPERDKAICDPFTVTQEDINTYADITGDHNPVHINKNIADETMFHSRIAHGMLIAGRTIAECLRVTEKDEIPSHLMMHFTAPVRPGDTVTPHVHRLDQPGEVYEWTGTNTEGKVVIKGTFSFPSQEQEIFSSGHTDK